MNSARRESRVTRTKAEAEEGYDRLSSWYDLIAGKSERPFREEGLRLIRPKNGEWVLELGFGTGECLLSLARSVGEAGKVFGIDISEGMLDVARRKLEKAGLGGRIDLVRGDAARLPFKDGYFDAVFTSFTLELFDSPEIPTVLKECKRVLKKGGRICVVAMSERGEPRLMMRLYEWAHRKMPRLCDCRPIYVETAIREAGFTVESSELLSMWGLPVEIVLGKTE